MEWIKWEIEKPETDTFINYVFSADDPDTKAGWCVNINNTMMVYDASDPGGDAIIPKEWKRLKNPEKDKWIKWEEQEPNAGKYLWIRDSKHSLISELAWAMGTAGNIQVVLPGDPSMGRNTEEEWQYVKMDN